MNAKEKLKAAHLRVTPNRVKILELIDHCDAPMSHFEILESLEKFDRVTLYRILDVLSDAGLIHKIQATDGAWRFCRNDLNAAKHCPGGHPHLLCESCGKMTCLNSIPLPHVDIAPDFHVSHKQFLIIGLCHNCFLKNKS